MSSSVNNIVNQPVNAFYRIEAQETIDFADIALDPDGLEFNLYKVDGTKVRVVSDLDDGSTVPSAGSGEIVIEVDVTTGDSRSTIASAVASALDGDSDLTASADGTVVTVKRVAVGEVSAPEDVDFGVKIRRTRKGKNLALGLLSEVPEVTTETNVFNITAQQSGQTVLGQLFQGANVSTSLVLLETGYSVVKELYGIYGSNGLTPSAGTEVAGMGSGAVGKSLLQEAARLELQPVTTIDSELSYAVSLMLCVPVPTSISFAGDEPRTLSVDFTGFADLTLQNSTINQLLIGDPSQDGL